MNTLLFVSKELDSEAGFLGRFKDAARHAKVPFTPQSVGTFLGVDRRKAAVWINGGMPRADKLFEYADKFGVDPRWFATGKGDMLGRPQPDGLPPDEGQLLDRYRDADPRWRLSLQLLAALATEEQIEAAADVNMVIARISGMRPQKLKPVDDQRMRDILKRSPEGWPPRVPVKKS